MTVTLRDELLFAIQDLCDGNPRSQQVEIGASEIGTPCVRKLAYKLGDVPPVNPDPGTWQQEVGTLIHAGLADMLHRWNKREPGRWLIEEEVTVGPFGRSRTLRGHGDAYDTKTHSVIDWKTLGAASLKKMKRNNHPGETYEVQVQCYGLAFARLRLPVQSVHILSLPQSGSLSQAWHWSAPFNPQIAYSAMERAHHLTLTGEAMGYAALGALSVAAEDYCEYCPWFSPRHPDPSVGRCGGTDAIQAERAKHTPAKPPLAFE
jgi:hypothetical protein